MLARDQNSKSVQTLDPSKNAVASTLVRDASASIPNHHYDAFAASFCSSTVGRIHGSVLTNCCVGTPSSKRRETTAEKLRRKGTVC